MKSLLFLLPFVSTVVLAMDPPNPLRNELELLRQHKNCADKQILHEKNLNEIFDEYNLDGRLFSPDDLQALFAHEGEEYLLRAGFSKVRLQIEAYLIGGLDGIGTKEELLKNIDEAVEQYRPNYEHASKIPELPEDKESRSCSNRARVFGDLSLKAIINKWQQYREENKALLNFIEIENKKVIAAHLDGLKKAELHFFWTTGRTLSARPEFGANTNVAIGGAKFGQRFFGYLDKLLKHSPNHLIVKLVSDRLTVNSNKPSIKELQRKYPERFEILWIDDVRRNLLDTFSSDDLPERINLIFSNAESGNPVIASDMYRLLGMPFSQEQYSDISQVQYSYCDVDLFCYAMQQPHYLQFLDALFKPTIKKPFYFGRRNDNNDLIKIHITDLESYKKFCKDMLFKFKMYASVLSHFVNIHNLIKQCEHDASCQDSEVLIAKLPNTRPNLVQEIMDATGPNFFHHKNINLDLRYPDTTAMEWDSPENTLNFSISRHRETDPTKIFNFGLPIDLPAEINEKIEAYVLACEIYRKALSGALYAQRFGSNHPFNVSMRAYLIKYFPYNTALFKELLTIDYKLYSHNNYEKWLNKINDRFQDADKHFMILNSLLKKLDIAVPFNLESLDFCPTSCSS